MPIITPDLSGVGPIEPGTYEAEIMAADPGTSKSGGSKLIVDFKVDVGNGQTKKRQSHLPIEGSGAFGFDQLLRACHLDEIADRLKDKSADHSFDTDALIGQKLLLVIEEQMYNGNKTDQIQTFLRA